MLRGAIVSPDPQLAGELVEKAGQFDRVTFARRLDHYPSGPELERFLRSAAPQVIFVSLSDMQAALQLASQTDALAPGTQVIAIHRVCSEAILKKLMRAGVREFLQSPFPADELRDSLSVALEALERRPVTVPMTDLIYSFLPSKPGVGSSTIAVNASAAMSRETERPVLLADFDLTCGMIGFMLKLEKDRSILDALHHAAELDEVMWPQLVSKFRKLDLLTSGVYRPDLAIETKHVRTLLDFMRCNYHAITFDLSGQMEPFTMDVLHASKRIFLVCTTELGSLRLAKQRLQTLVDLEYGPRVSVLVNRMNERGLSRKGIEDVIGRRVEIYIPNDYTEVQRALEQGTTVGENSTLGIEFQNLARVLLEKEPGETPAPERRPFLGWLGGMPAFRW